MGYYGGKGVPFYNLFTIPGKDPKPSKEARTRLVIN